MDSIRNQIWDFLYRTDGPKSITDIAQHLVNDEQAVRQAVHHDWFHVIGDKVSIAYA